MSMLHLVVRQFAVIVFLNCHQALKPIELTSVCLIIRSSSLTNFYIMVFRFQWISSFYPVFTMYLF